MRAIKIQLIKIEFKKQEFQKRIGSFKISYTLLFSGT
jgi:hypothetical protein